MGMWVDGRTGKVSAGSVQEIVFQAPKTLHLSMKNGYLRAESSRSLLPIHPLTYPLLQSPTPSIPSVRRIEIVDTKLRID